MEQFRIDGKVALVTGASHGIGFGIAVALAKAGAKVAFNCRTAERRDAAVAAYREAGVEVAGYVGDVTNEDQMARCSPTSRRPWGRWTSW